MLLVRGYLTDPMLRVLLLACPNLATERGSGPGRDSGRARVARTITTKGGYDETDDCGGFGADDSAIISRCRAGRRAGNPARVQDDAGHRLAFDTPDRGQGGSGQGNLKKIKLPDGFHIGLYALVPDARHMAVGPQGIVTIVGTRKTKIWAVTDRSRSGLAEEVKEFAPTLPKKLPNGPRASPRTGSSTSSSRTACCNIRRRSSSTRAQTSRSESSCRKAS